MADFQRSRDGFRFSFGGMKVNARPDAVPLGKYPIAVNVREYEDGTIRTRPGTTQLFTIGITDHAQAIRGYSGLNTDALPRFLVYTTAAVYLDNGSLVGTFSGSSLQGASMIPFRPSASPTPWMYVANGVDYQKFSAPVVNAVTQAKVGIAEPPAPPDAQISFLFIANPNPGAPPTYLNAGTAGASANGVRITDTTGAVLQDPAAVGGQTLYSVQVSATVAYQRSMILTIGGAGHNCFVQDVFPASPVALKLSGIFYFSGTTGHCVLVVNALTGKSEEDSIYGPLLLASLRRGSIMQIAAEFVFVQSVTPGPDGSFAVETSTTSTHTTADTILLIPAIQVNSEGFVVSPGQAIADVIPPKNYQVTTGLGTQTTPGGSVAPFILGTGVAFQENDYISIGFKVDVPANITEIKVLFDVDDATFLKNFYYHTIRASDLATAINNTVTQLAASQTLTQRAIIDEEDAISSGNQGVSFSSSQGPTGQSQWIQIVFPISELNRVGTDGTKSLLTYTAFQVLWNVSGTVNVAQDGYFTVFGGSQPDVGDVGAPYRYRVRPRASTTGVVGNPSPATRYGINPRRELVIVSLPSAAYDSQIDTWDVFRYGGAVTSWRFIGSTPSSNTTFLDNFSDDAALGGDELEFDNFEPWPSVDVPFSHTGVNATGFTALVPVSPAGNVTRFLPGTLVQLGGTNVYTLQRRPTLQSAGVYLFQFLENAGTQTNVRAVIQEPILARQNLPYMWGPDANGNVFACGDPLRPGTLYFAKPYVPDSAPDSYNQEISQPTEPLLGGEIIDGVSLVGSSEGWWRLYFQPDNPAQRFTAVKEPIPRGLAAPFGHCTDGKSLYFWAKDGIYRNDQPLTDEDLYTLFPHEGVAGNDYTYNGVTIKAPGYAFAAQFRLTYHQGYLYAIYADSSGLFHCLTGDLRRGRAAWIYDSYAVPPTAIYHVEQPGESNASLNPLLIMGLGFTGASIIVAKQTDLTNDAGAAGITCSLAMPEYDGGDVRAPKQWGDHFLDLVPAANAVISPGVTVTPMSLGVGVAAPTVIPQSPARSRNPVSVGGTVVSDFMGLFLTWKDDFTQQAVQTQLFVWQPSFDVQPAKTIGWKTFGTSFGMQGYGHIRQIAIAWVSTATITLTITSFDGQSPQVITIPSSGGAYQKQLFPVSANKGQLYVFQATSAAPFQIFEEDLEVHVGGWARSGAYQIFKSFGGSPNAESPV